MEKLNLVKNGVLRLPPGFRFHPTDEELVVQYLKRKVMCLPLPASVIPQFDVSKSDPWDLPGDWEQERYYFSSREAKYPNGNRSNRATVSGYWKASGNDKKISLSRTNQVVGMKKTLVFYRGKSPNGSKTNWIMHEYRLDDSYNNLENWVICKIFLKRKCGKIEKDHYYGIVDDYEVIEHKPVFYDFMGRSSVSSSSSGCSGITEVISGNNAASDQHEDSTNCNSFS